MTCGAAVTWGLPAIWAVPTIFNRNKAVVGRLWKWLSASLDVSQRGCQVPSGARPGEQAGAGVQECSLWKLFAAMCRLMMHSGLESQPYKDTMTDRLRWWTRIWFCPQGLESLRCRLFAAVLSMSPRAHHDTVSCYTILQYSTSSRWGEANLVSHHQDHKARKWNRAINRQGT